MPCVQGGFERRESTHTKSKEDGPPQECVPWRREERFTWQKKRQESQQEDEGTLGRLFKVAQGVGLNPSINLLKETSIVVLWSLAHGIREPR